MKDWHLRIEKYKERVSALERSKWEEEQRKKKEVREREERKRMQRFFRKFFCRICLTVSPGPEVRPKKFLDGSPYCYEVVWDKPVGLKRCELCRRWVCSICNYKGVCKECAEKSLS